MFASELYEKVSEKIGLPKSKVKAVIETMSEEVLTAAKNGDSVRIAAIGTLKPREVKERMGHNPQDPGKKVVVPAHTRLVFQESTTTKAYLNG